ncbi:hypothetical protein CBR_g38250 [Chara braunii]|uniref:DUF659 domain-containing protein n=1 Tax=Chara braunii TaxID=69332 RepID=A0A388LPU2_CHABU|nr:hypothetical protein CBR_g38250 [Chara braunii]|eukprot:GBG84279.1 hypothetical protein CBR_g38250 [Chara braunii]
MPRGVKPALPQFRRIAGIGIQEERLHIADKLRDIHGQMEHTRATILTDGRKSLNSEPIVNFLAVGQSGAFLYTTVRREGVDVETADVVLRRWKVFEDFGAKKINVICTDSASFYVTADRALRDDPDPDICRIPWLPCSVHCCNLMLCDMVKDKTWAIELLTRARAVVRFIKSHGSALALFRIYSAKADRGAGDERVSGSVAGGEEACGKRRWGRELLYPCQTRFTSMYIMMERLRDCRVPLETMMLEGDWARLPWARRLLAQAGWVRTQLAEEIRKLELARPHLVGMLQDCYGRACYLLDPAHVATHLLNPKRRNFVYFQSCHRNSHQKKVAGMTLEYIYTQTDFDGRGERYRLVHQQLYDFHSRGPRYDWGGDAGTGDEDMCQGVDETHTIADWWVLHDGCAPELCSIATRLMYTWVCASPAERNCVLHERIHEKRRNGLDFTKLTEMVKMCVNKKLLTCRAGRRGLVLPWGDLEEGLDEVPEPRRSGTLSPGLLTDVEIRRQARKMQCASTVRHPPLVQSVFGRRATHIELYDEEIEYEPPVDPQAADEMEAEAWTDPEELEQGGIDAPEGGEASCGESEHAAASDMREDNGGEDGDVADDEDSDDKYMVGGEDPDGAASQGTECGSDGGAVHGTTGDAGLVTHAAGAAGVDVGGLQGCGLDVPQGLIPSGIFKDDFDVGRPLTSETRGGGVRARTPASDVVHRIGSVFVGVSPGMLAEVAGAKGDGKEGKRGDEQLALERDMARAREMGCAVEAVTAARLAVESGHAIRATGTVNGHDGDDTFGDGITRRRNDDEGDGGDVAVTADAGGLPVCDGTEEDGQLAVAYVALTDAVPHRPGVEDAILDT